MEAAYLASECDEAEVEAAASSYMHAELDLRCAERRLEIEAQVENYMGKLRSLREAHESLTVH